MEITELIGKTLTKVQNTESEIIFTCNDGKKYKLFHEQECSESVNVEDIIGVLTDLIKSPILKASKDTSDKNPEGIEKKCRDYFKYQDSFTWTFYNLSTIKGSVTIRFYGESNGYYSESVTFCEC